MNPEIKKLILETLNKLNYDSNDEELIKYLYEKGNKAINIIENGNYSLEEIKKIMIENIPTLIEEYVRFSNSISEKSQSITAFGTSINYQLIDLFEIANTSSTSEEFENKKKVYLKKQPRQFQGLEESTYDEIKNIFSNVIKNCDCITPEAEAKMTLTFKDGVSLFAENGVFNYEVFDFEYFDKIVDFAKNNNMKVRLHTLLWHKHFPKVLENCSREECLHVLDLYFSVLSKKYGEKIFSSVDVINEICSDIASKEFKDGKILRDSPWKDKLGEKYYIDVLKLARKHFPNNCLVYNEYDEINDTKRNNMISIIEEVKREEEKSVVKLLDAIGLQSHYHEYTTDEEIKKTYYELSKLGKHIQITELDIAKITNNDDEQVNRIARTVLDCASTYGINYITCWGPSGKVSWKSRKVRTFLNVDGTIDQNIKKIINTYSMRKKIYIYENLEHNSVKL